jgi:hypothetical protein
MKHLTLLLLISLIYHSNADGQIRQQYYKPEKPGKHIGGVTRAGFICIGAGAISFFAGDKKIEMDTKHDPSIGVGNGITPVVLGLVSVISGLGLTIGGAVHDGHVYRKGKRLSLVLQKWNQVGLAYNF